MLTGGAILAGAVFLYWQNSSLEPLREQAATLSVQTQDAEHVYQKLDQAKKDDADLQAKLAHLEQGIPDLAYVPTMLQELALEGKKMGVEVTGIRPTVKPGTVVMTDKEKKDEDKKPYQALDLEMKGRSKYDDLTKFVTALNQFPKIVEVRTLAINPPALAQRAKDSRLDFTLGMRAFLFKEKTAPAAKPAGQEGSI